jgi:Cu/Zn superoxide dismutase
MRQPRARFLAVASALAFAAAGALAADKPVTVMLKAQNGSGETGQATLTPEGTGKTRVDLTLEGAPATAQPAHFHEGSCAKLDPKPKYPLQNVVNGKSTTTLPVSVSQLEGLAINVHKSAEDLKTYVACGDTGKS